MTVGPDRGDTELMEARKDLYDAFFSCAVGPPIDIAPLPGDIGPHEQLKALNKAVVSAPAL
jgi:hypothetical protein